MPDDHLPKQLLYGELCCGKRSVGGQKKRLKDTLKKTLTIFNSDVTNWEAWAQDRPLWRSIIHTGATAAETNRIAEAQKKRAALKAKLYSTTSTSQGPTYPCLECGRVLQARIGLISHLRTHRANQSWHHHRRSNWCVSLDLALTLSVQIISLGCMHAEPKFLYTRTVPCQPDVPVVIFW